MKPTAIAIALLAAACSESTYQVHTDFATNSTTSMTVGIDTSGKPGQVQAQTLRDLDDVSVQSARLESLDGGDLSFIDFFQLQTDGGFMPTHGVASFKAPPPAGTTSVQIPVGEDVFILDDLKSGASLDALMFFSVAPAAPRSLRLTVTLSVDASPPPGSD